MQCRPVHNTTMKQECSTDTNKGYNITYNYKKRREELNQIVKSHLERQQKGVASEHKKEEQIRAV